MNIKRFDVIADIYKLGEGMTEEVIAQSVTEFEADNIICKYANARKAEVKDGDN